MSRVASAVWFASVFTSAATTEKPRPASPARAASIVAFSARRFVWLATPAIVVTTLPIEEAARSSSPISDFSEPTLAFVWRTASRLWFARRSTSSIDPTSSALAAAVEIRLSDPC